MASEVGDQRSTVEPAVDLAGRSVKTIMSKQIKSKAGVEDDRKRTFFYRVRRRDVFVMSSKEAISVGFFEFEWRFYTQSASKAIFRASTVIKPIQSGDDDYLMK